MIITKRYTFWKVFWVVFTVNLFFIGLAIISMSMMPGSGFDWKQLLMPNQLAREGIGIILCTTYYFVALNYFNQLFIKKSGITPYLSFSSLSIIAVAVYFLLRNLFFPSTEVMKTKPPMSVMMLSYAISSIFVVGIALLIAYLNNLRDERMQRKVLEEQKMQLEVEKSQANLNFLKAQINPHFLHNTLNFLYAKSLPLSAELSEGILTLSDIMRYALSEGNAENGKALLSQEVEHVQNVIKINQLRFSNNLNVRFQVNGVMNGATIIPFVLITLVENAFKHGDLKSPENPIEVTLDIDKDKMHFRCHNKKKAGSKELSTGIGLDNIRKRLELAYGKRHTFKVKDEDGSYTTELTIHYV
jgi:two-component system LytT family sensor kinase